ncbi:hypothetical protein [Streptomyces sp. NPDC057494]|uniref:hypothetical protein n=1 Tax=Streptomyces sp. NPDC057494 TaxID=3346148 RepID=UPI0036BF632E
MQPVLEISTPEGFALWPVAEVKPYSFLPLSGQLSPAEVGTALMRLADCNDIDPSPEDDDRRPRPADPLGSFLHGLLTLDNLFAAGGLRVTDGSTGISFLPGCCTGLEDWRDWHEVLDGSGSASFGHDPDPLAERLGDTIRLTVDVEQSDSPVIEVPVTELRHLLSDAERDLISFVALTADWAARHLPDHAASVTSAVARALALSSSAVPSKPYGDVLWSTGGRSSA